MPTQGSSERLSLFFCRKQSTGLFLTAGQYLACPARQERPTHRPKLRLGSFLLPKTVHRTVFNGRTIPGLPRKMGIPTQKCSSDCLSTFFYYGSMSISYKLPKFFVQLPLHRNTSGSLWKYLRHCCNIPRLLINR